MELIINIFLFLFIFFLIVVVSILPAICVIVTILTLIFSERIHLLRNLITTNVAAIIFLFSFSIFTSFSILFGEKKSLDAGYGDCRYIQITPQYKIISIDNMPFYIEGKQSIDIDSIAEVDSFLFGLSNTKYFCLSLKNDSLQYDSVFSNLNLPASCTQEKLTDAETYYYDKYKRNSRSIWEIIRVPLLLAIVITFISSFFLKTIIDWLEKLIQSWITHIKERKRLQQNSTNSIEEQE